MTQPYYMIDFSAAGCRFEITINDVSLIDMNVKGQVASIIPANFSILKSGKQILFAKILPLIGQTKISTHASFNCNIKLFDADNDFIFKEQIEGFKLEESDKESLTIKTHQKDFNATVPYNLQAWQNGKTLKHIEGKEEKLKQAYNKIIAAIKAKNYKTYSETIKNREAIMASTMFLDNKEKQARIDDLITDFESGFEIFPLSDDAVYCEYGYGKLACFKRITGESALYLYNPATKEELSLDINFYIAADKDTFEVI